MKDLFPFPFGCQKHSAGVRAVHDSDFSNGLRGIRVCWDFSLLFHTTSDDTMKVRQVSMQAGRQGHFVYTSSVHISLSFPTTSHRQIFFSHLPKIVCISQSLPSSTAKKSESPGSSFRADPQCIHVEKMLASTTVRTDLLSHDKEINETTRGFRHSSRHNPKLSPPILRRRFVSESPFP